MNPALLYVASICISLYASDIEVVLLKLNVLKITSDFLLPVENGLHCATKFSPSRTFSNHLSSVLLFIRAIRKILMGNRYANSRMQKMTSRFFRNKGSHSVMIHKFNARWPILAHQHFLFFFNKYVIESSYGEVISFLHQPNKTFTTAYLFFTFFRCS